MEAHVYKCVFDAISDKGIVVFRNHEFNVAAVSITDAINGLKKYWRNKEVTTEPGKPLVRPKPLELPDGTVRDFSRSIEYESTWRNIIVKIDISSVVRLNSVDELSEKLMEAGAETEAELANCDLFGTLFKTDYRLEDLSVEDMPPFVSSNIIAGSSNDISVSSTEHCSSDPQTLHTYRLYEHAALLYVDFITDEAVRFLSS